MRPERTLKLGALAAAVGVTPRVVRAWLVRGMPHGRRDGARGPYLFDLAEVRAWRERHDAAEAQRLFERRLRVIEGDSGLVLVKLHGEAKVRCDECHYNGPPPMSRREKRLGRFHRAFRRWRRSFSRSATGERCEGEPILMCVVECGRCWRPLVRKRADRVPGADVLPIRNDRPVRQVAIFA